MFRKAYRRFVADGLKRTEETPREKLVGHTEYSLFNRKHGLEKPQKLTFQALPRIRF
jgi:hypothetical protein